MQRHGFCRCWLATGTGWCAAGFPAPPGSQRGQLCGPVWTGLGFSKRSKSLNHFLIDNTWQSVNHFLIDNTWPSVTGCCWVPMGWSIRPGHALPSISGKTAGSPPGCQPATSRSSARCHYGSPWSTTALAAVTGIQGAPCHRHTTQQGRVSALFVWRNGSRLYVKKT